MSTESSIVSGPARIVAALATLFVLALLLAGCSSSSDEAGSPAAAPAEADAGGDEGTGDGTETDDSSTASRSVIVTGSMNITVERPLDAADKAATIVKGAGGRVDARDETAPDEWNGGSATLTLRIPADRLDAVVEDLRALGTVDQFATTASDVTNEVTDLDAHISTLQASTKRIEALLVDAKDITDIIKLEDELASRQADLESLEAQQRGLGDQVALSTIELSLTTVPVAIEDESPSTFFDGLAAGWNGLVNFVSVALVVFGALLPWLVVAAVIAIVIVTITRRRKTRAPGTITAPPADEPVAAEATAP